MRLQSLQNQDPEATERLFEKACLLDRGGQTEAAKSAYLALLMRAPRHAGALNNLGTLLYSTGFRTAARTAYSEAVQRYPHDPMGLVNLANVLAEAGELDSARKHYEAALAADPAHRGAHQGLGNLLDALGEEEASKEHQRLGHRGVTEIPYRGQGQAVSVLLLIASGRGGNVPIRPLLEDRVFRTFAVAPEFFDSGSALPPHQLVVNAIGDADLCAAALDGAVNLVERTLAPVINPPAAVLGTGRVANALRLGALPGVVAPKMTRVVRDQLDKLECPVLLRAPGFHNGAHFVRAQSAQELLRVLPTLPGNEFTAIGFLDARGHDGKYRKYRVMMIDGRLYPLHLAISNRWKIHYVTADMADNAAHRAEEARFLEDMPAVLGPRAMAALRLIQETLALDYAGIDFALNTSGDVLLFEANANMIVPEPAPDERWAYRQEPVKRIHKAVRKMLLEKAGA